MKRPSSVPPSVRRADRDRRARKASEDKQANADKEAKERAESDAYHEDLMSLATHKDKGLCMVMMVARRSLCYRHATTRFLSGFHLCDEHTEAWLNSHSDWSEARRDAIRAQLKQIDQVQV